MVNRRIGNMRKESGGKKGGFFSHYRPPPSDHVKRQGERRGGKFDSIFKGNFGTFTPKEGDNTIRILPAGWEGNDDYAYRVWIHWGIGADESAYLCLRKMKNETCPICQEVARMKADGEGDDAKRIDCKERFICWIIDRNDRDESPTLYSMPAQVYKDLNALCYSSKTGKAIFIDNPDDGYDVTIRRTGTKLNTKYLPSVDRDATAVTDDADKYKELEDWVQDKQVPECLQFFDADYLEKALSGEIDRNKDGDDEDDDDRKSARRSRDDGSRPARGRGRDADEDEEEEDDAPPPRMGKGASKGGKGREDDEDDDLDDELPFGDDDEEDEDEAEDESENEAREARADARHRDRRDNKDRTGKRPGANKHRPSRDEDEDEASDEPDDEDEDNNPPLSRTRVKDRGERRSGNRTSGNRRI